ncbi:hypothetical protein AVEN_23258-1 [Araneus ventricosus]|uniref:RNase H type-1 domain-containing protein n=1 Tax=Araneus ventricosus TaxID=182803 RepID=A0A4Y2K2U4_ARAVE|nr:hypothetical protein AVEN_23258-1 [Araneus ventricosus]
MQKEEYGEWMSIDEGIPVAVKLSDLEICQAVCEQVDDSDEEECVEENRPTNAEMIFSKVACSVVQQILKNNTNGSKTDKETTSAFCVFRHGFIHHKWWAKLDDNNSVFQAEMVALREAMRWLSQESLARGTIHSDSQSFLKAFAALQPNSNIAREILKHMELFKNRSWDLLC